VNESTSLEATHLRVAELVQGLHNRPDTDSDTVIAELAEHAAAEIPGAQYAGITLTRNARRVETPAATHHWPLLLDKIQQRHLEGPCLTAAWDETTVHVRDLESDDRFPNYRRDALAETPVRSIMAFQMFIAGETLGALNIYAEQPNAFGDESRTLGLIFAAHSSVAWNSARRDAQFQKALSSRDIIGQAKGMIMERYRVDAVQAFELLRKLSQDSNVALIKVAADLVADAQTADAQAAEG
jgi:transcriptional regulator with GAF, ATPase, and Fis domain